MAGKKTAAGKMPGRAAKARKRAATRVKPKAKPASKPDIKPAARKTGTARSAVAGGQPKRQENAPSAIRRPARNTPWDQCVELAPGVTLYQGDCTAVMAALEPASVHAVVTDPPYELGFMGKSWDAVGGVASNPATWAHALAALRPGGHLVAFAGSRTYHRIACAIEDAGFEIRDQLMWLYGSGFPKSHDVSKAIDRSVGAKRRVIAPSRRHGGGASSIFNERGHDPIAAAACSDARQWDGWGTALKPAHEPIVLARKSMSGTVVETVLAHGAGALNVKAATVGDEFLPGRDAGQARVGTFERHDMTTPDRNGRWPANVLHDGSFEVFEALPFASRDAFRFFYSAKAAREEREFGLADAPKRTGGMTSNTSGQHITRRDGGAPGPRGNFHPTVKPVDLMRWLVRLTTRLGGTVLEPFMGSGSTGIAAVREGAGFVGIEQSPEYFEIARRRIEAALDERARMPDLIAHAATRTPPAEQLGMFG